MVTAIPELWRWTRLDSDFATLAHAHQEAPPAANNGGPWTTWLALGGRGAGKTRLGAEWVRALAHGTPPYADAPHRRIALVGESEHDAREVMIEGVSGLLRISPRGERPVWMSSRRRLEWPNGAVAQAFSAEDPESLARAAVRRRLVRRARQVAPRGGRLRHAAVRPAAGRAPAPAHHHHAAADRAAQAPARRSAHRGHARRDAGERRASVARVPRRSGGALRRHAARPPGDRRRDHRGPAGRAVVARDDRRRACRGAAACPHRGRDRSAGVVAAEAPTRAASSRRAAPRTAASMCWRTRRPRALAPAGWAAKAVALYRRLEADTLVAEVNQGGDMVRAVLRAGRRFRAAQDRARDARQMAARRAGRRDVCAGQA